MRLVFLSTILLFRDGDLPLPSGPPLPPGLVRRLTPTPSCPLGQLLDLLPLKIHTGRQRLGGRCCCCFCCSCCGCLGRLLGESTRQLQDCGLGSTKKTKEKTCDNYRDNSCDNLIRARSPPGITPAITS